MTAHFCWLSLLPQQPCTQTYLRKAPFLRSLTHSLQNMSATETWNVQGCSSNRRELPAEREWAELDSLGTARINTPSSRAEPELLPAAAPSVPSLEPWGKVRAIPPHHGHCTDSKIHSTGTCSDRTCSDRTCSDRTCSDRDLAGCFWGINSSQGHTA